MRILALCIVSLCLLNAASAAEVRSEMPWHTSLAYSGGGVWMSRVPIAVTNTTENEWKGFPVGVELSRETSGAIGDVDVFTLRVAQRDGAEVVFAAQRRDGILQLVIPVDAAAKATVHYVLYFGNDAQYCRVPPQEQLVERLAIVNGGFEDGDSVSVPTVWRLDESDATHKVSWSTEHPATGKRCIKTTVADGAEPSWISARQDSLIVQPSRRYRLSGKVRGENIRGTAGWYIHVGPAGKQFTASPMATTNESSFDWKTLAVEFVTPADAAVADLGTVLRGTGTAWFDDVVLELFDKDDKDAQPPHVVCGAIEKCPFARVGTVTPPTPDADARTLFRIVNASSETITAPTVLFDISSALAFGRIATPEQIVVCEPNGNRTSAAVLGAARRQAVATLTHPIPPKSITILPLDYKLRESAATTNAATSQNKTTSDLSQTAHPDQQQSRDATASLTNLLKNGDFESETSDGWNGAGTLERDPQIVRFGKQCARLEMRDEHNGQWRGFTQSAAVQGGKAYLVTGWLRCRDMPGGARIHIHFRKSDGEIVAAGGMTSIDRDIRATTDWTHCSQLFVAPPDAASMTVHLTSSGVGTLWHDNIAVYDSLLAEMIGVESLAPKIDGTQLWQVPAVMKVFPTTLPPQNIRTMQTAKISAARNEKEPLQIAVKDGGSGSLRLHVSDVTSDAGAKISAPPVGVVGYVPIDYPTNYYQETTPSWFRHTPRSAIGCDGWAGAWPDPIVETDTLVRTEKTSQTDAFYSTWSIPKDAAAGVYRGTIRLENANGTTLATMPLELTVYDFALPDKSSVSATYDARFNGPSNIWGERAYNKGVAMMTQNRIEPDAVQPEIVPTWSGDECTFDFTEFDRVARALVETRGVRFLYTPNFFYCFGWGHPPRAIGDAQPYSGEWPFKDADRSVLSATYKTRYQNALRVFWQHISERGWADKFVLYISDEPNHWEKPIEQQMVALCAMIHEVDPAIPIYCSTWGYVPAWKDSLDVWGIGHYGIVPPETMKTIRRDGSRIWFTTDGMLCLDTPYSAIERLLPYYCFRYDAEAYEFWGVGWLTVNPWDFGSHSFIHQSSIPGEYYYVRYPNGDGYLLYPPRHSGDKISSSVRFEQAREGVEDYEYFTILRDAIARHSAAKSTDAATLREAADALRAATELIESPCAIGRYSTEILPDPRRIEEVRERVARVIEKL